jgi:aspartate aminotransferase
MSQATFDLPSGDPKRGLSQMANGLVGSEILKIAAEIRKKQAAGAQICNLTVGDFSSKEFPIPKALLDGIVRALQAGETNYPPSDGVLKLREAVRDFYRNRLHLDVPLESVVIAGGSRPIIYAIFAALVEEGDTVVYPVPSWNNNHYVHLTGAKGIAVQCRAEDGFLPTAAQLAPHLSEARLLSLNSPLNPAGTLLPESEVRKIGELVVAENQRREPLGLKPLYVLYDQVYWQLTFGAARHVTPVELVPACAPYVIFVDGISKAFAATGVRVGWGVGPRSVIAAMRDILGHVGAWAPRAEQVATAELLRDGAELQRYSAWLHDGLQARLGKLHRGFAAMAEAGLPVGSIAPQGAIYLSVRFDLIGKRGINSNDQIRRLLLDEAGFAVVPFQAFGLAEENGWFRLSVGAVSEREIDAALPRVEAALRKLLA